MTALSATILIFCLVCIGLFLAAFWVRGGMFTLRVSSQIILVLLLFVAMILFIESLGYAVVPVGERLGNALYFIMVGAMLVSGVVFIALGITTVVVNLRQHRWGHVVGILVLGGAPAVLFVWLIFDWLVNAHNEDLLSLLVAQPLVMLPFLVYSTFFATGREKRSETLGLQK